MDNNFNKKQQFAQKLNEDLNRLAQKWRAERNDPKIDEQIDAIRQSAKILLDRVEFDLARMSVGSPYEDHQEFFVGLTDKDYTPRIQGSSLAPNSDERKAALKLLKNLASYIGATIHRDNTTVAAEATNESTATAEYIDPSGDGFKETTPDSHVRNPAPTPAATFTLEDPAQEDDKSFDWHYDIPAAETVDEFAALREEAGDIKEIISKATSATELIAYITTTLKPRLTEIKQDLKARRELSPTETTYHLMNANLIDFADSLELLMLQGLRRANQKSLQTSAIALAAPTKPETLESRLEKLASRIDAGLAKAQGAPLKNFYDNRLKPKLISLKDEIDALKDSGNNPDLLNEKQQHFNVIKEAMTKAYQKIQAEKSAEASKPKDFYAEVLKPEAMALIAEIATMKKSGGDQAEVEAKERHLKVLQASMSKILNKRRADIDAEIAASATKPNNLPVLTEEILVFPALPVAEIATAKTEKLWTPENEAPFKLPDEETVQSATDFPTLPPVEVIEVDVEPRQYSPNVTLFLKGMDKPDDPTKNPHVVSDVQFKMQHHKPIEFQFEKPAANNGFFKRHWKAATALVASASAAVALAASFALSTGSAPDTQSVKKVATPEPTAQAVQQAAVQQPTVIVAAAPANDVASAPIAEVAAPEPTIEATPVAPTVQAKVSNIVKHFVAKAKSTVKTVEPTVSIQDDTPIVEKTWDIATSRVDLETWSSACKELNQHNLTVSGVCPS